MYVICFLIRSSKGLGPDQPWVRGVATLSVNEWFKYFNVRSSPVDLVAGNEYIVKIEPMQHTASSEIRSVDPEKRKCKFEDEGVSIKVIDLVLFRGFYCDHELFDNI